MVKKKTRRPKRRSSRSRQTGHAKLDKVPYWQWRMMAGFTRDGVMLSLQDVFSHAGAVHFRDLTPRQKAEVTRARFEALRGYQGVTLANGKRMDKEDALGILRSLVPGKKGRGATQRPSAETRGLAQYLVEVEEEMIAILEERARRTGDVERRS